MEGGKIDKDKQCRICMASKPNQVSIFNELNLSLKLMELADIQVVEGDGLPPAICTDCEADLEKCYEFRSQVRWADEKLREGSASPIEVEECNIKIELDHGACGTLTEEDSDIGDYKNDSHVEEIENQIEDTNMLNDPFGQEEPLIEAAEMTSEVGATDDPLKCVKVETTEAMETDTCGPSTSALPPSMVREIEPKTSVLMKSNHITQKAFNEMNLEMLQPCRENHLITDQTQHTPLLAASVTDLTSSNHLSKGYVISAYPSVLTNQMTYAQNNDSLTLEVCINEPTTTDTIYKPIQTNSSFSKSDLNIEKFSELNKNATVIKKHEKPKGQGHSTTLDTTNDVQLNESMESKTVESTHNEATVENDSSYVLKGVENWCVICDVNFWSEELLNKHLEGNEYTCRSCTAEFSKHDELKSHFLSHPRSQCVVCKKSFLCKEDLFNHKKTSLTCTPKFECDICHKMFSSHKTCKQHKKLNHPIKNNILNNCVVCDKNFLLPTKLNGHQNKCHVAYETIECKFCGLFYLGPEKLKHHTIHNHLKKRKICPFACSICGKILSSQRTLAEHKQTHEEKEMVVCEICGKSYPGTKSLSHHIKYYHISSNKLKCSRCNEEFSYKAALEVHVKKEHLKRVKTPVMCEICGITLKNKYQLKTHLQIHSNERQFKCQVCNATFKQKVALKTHSRIHSGICNFSCNDCGQSFRWKQTFVKHRIKCQATENTLN